MRFHWSSYPHAAHRRLKYRLNGREKLLSLGTYPEIPLKTARERRDQARQLLASGGDPSAQRQSEKVAFADTFEAIAREWLELKSKSLDPRTHQKKKERFEAFVFPYLGSKPIRSTAAADVPGSGEEHFGVRYKMKLTHRRRRAAVAALVAAAALADLRV